MLIVDVASVVVNQEAVASRLKVGVGAQSTESLDKRCVGSSRIGMGCGARIVECCKDAGWALVFNELADDLLSQQSQQK